MSDQDQAARQVLDEDSVALRLLAKDAEIERLRELVNDLHQCGDISPDLWDRIKKEVGDE